MITATNKNVLLAVCGGIAAYKAAELVRLLRKNGANVRVAMTPSAKNFIGPLTLQALSGHPVHTDLLNPDEENAMGHISLARWADVMIIAPATANTLAKCACGMADNLVTALYLAADCPVYMAPAMNQAMWSKAATQENIRRLNNAGVTLIGPESGDQACGETGYGRMSEPAEICRQLSAGTETSVLSGIKVLISAGPTREYIDPVRYISNRSSGKMGYAIARAAVQAGAEVSLVSGPVNLTAPANVTLVRVESAAQMYDAVMSSAGNADIYIGTAAVADYSPAETSTGKIKKDREHIELALSKTQDILSAVARMGSAPFVVGFAAETHDLEGYALKKLHEKNLDMIAANWVGRQEGGFDSEQNALEIFWKNGRVSLPMADKKRISTLLIDIIATKFHEKNRV